MAQTFRALLAPIAPYHNLANIVSLEPSTPCIHCATVVPDRSKARNNLIKTNYERIDTYPDFPSLKDSAKSGCGFCRLLRKTIRANWAARPMEEWGAGPLRESDEHWSELFDSPWDRQVRIHNATFTVGRKTLNIVQKNVGNLDEHLPISDEFYSVFKLTYQFGPATTAQKSNGDFYGEIGQVISFKIFDSLDLDSATKESGRRLPSVASLSDENLARISGWIHECRETHDKCKLDPSRWVPTRLIDVDAQNEFGDPRLVETAQERISGSYAALSHVWGDPNKHPPPLDTKIKTLDDRLSEFGIPMFQLSKNFQDAVTVTRSLGLRYIWIDSLCIVQDSGEDWTRESAMMQQVYKNAAITIAATWAESAHSGFLQRSLTITPCVKIKCTPGSPRALPAYFIASPMNDFDTGTWSSDVRRSLWNTRGWTLQERSLSARILHFCRDKIYFECRREVKSEEGEPAEKSEISIMWPIDPRSSSGHAVGSSDSTEATVRQEFYERWMLTVAEYSMRKLTKGSDKLPALQGLVNDMAEATGDTNVAGLWKGNMAQELLWQVREGITSRPREQQAPSWSWASMNAKIGWNRFAMRSLPGKAPFRTEIVFEYLDVGVGEPPPRQTERQIPEIYIMIRGVLQDLVSVRECSYDDRWTWGTRTFPYDLGIGISGLHGSDITPSSLGNDAEEPSPQLDMDFHDIKFAEGVLDLDDKDGLSLSKERKLSYLHITDSSRPTGLILEAVDDTHRNFCRVGVATVLDISGVPFLDPSPIGYGHPAELSIY